jgi:hypothetical protein
MIFDLDLIIFIQWSLWRLCRLLRCQRFQREREFSECEFLDRRVLFYELTSAADIDRTVSWNTEWRESRLDNSWRWRWDDLWNDSQLRSERDQVSLSLQSRSWSQWSISDKLVSCSSLLRTCSTLKRWLSSLMSRFDCLYRCRSWIWLNDCILSWSDREWQLQFLRSWRWLWSKIFIKESRRRKLWAQICRDLYWRLRHIWFSASVENLAERKACADAASDWRREIDWRALWDS